MHRGGASLAEWRARVLVAEPSKGDERQLHRLQLNQKLRGAFSDFALQKVTTVLKDANAAAVTIFEQCWHIADYSTTTGWMLANHGNSFFFFNSVAFSSTRPFWAGLGRLMSLHVIACLRSAFVWARGRE